MKRTIKNTTVKELKDQLATIMAMLDTLPDDTHVGHITEEGSYCSHPEMYAKFHDIEDPWFEIDIDW